MSNKFLIKNPIITEKTAILEKIGKYVFLVNQDATVSEARKAVEDIYKVKVIRAQVINIKEKKRRLGRSVGVKPGYKKIIMTLSEGQKLDIIPQ